MSTPSNMQMPSTLEVGGLVEHPRTFALADLRSLPGQVPDVSVVIPGREGGAVSLASLMAASGPMPEARYLTLEADDLTASIPLDAVLNQAMLLYRVGDELVPHSSGGPVRFLIPDVSACGTDEVDTCANVKYLHRITLTAQRGPDSRPKNRIQHEDLHRPD